METERETLNISSRPRESSPEGQLLSNLSHAPFWLDGNLYESVEGFWQGLYFPEGSEERKRIATLFGREAKLAGANKPEGITQITYQGELVELGSPQHHALMRKAIHEKIMQNADVRSALVRTGSRRLTHILMKPDGTLEPDSKSIPAAVFTQILMDERELINNTPAPIL